MHLLVDTCCFRSPEKESFGHRFFSSNQDMSVLRSMRTSLTSHCKLLQGHIALLDDPKWAEKVGVANPSEERRETLKSFFPKCLK